MIYTFIRCFTVIFFSFYTYIKLLNFDLRSKPYIKIYLLFSLILTSLISLIIYFYPDINAMVLSLGYIAVSTIHTKTEIRLSIMTGVLSYGISNIIFVISAIISGIFLVPLGYDENSDLLLPFILTGIIGFIILIMLFRIKRLKKGMPFLTEPAANNIGIIISLLVIACIFILLGNDASLIYIVPITIIIICAVIIIIWWNKRLTRTYLNRKREAEFTKLYKTIEEKDEYIEQLKQQNVTLGNLIHKDNKLVPAMELAVTDLLINYRDKDAEEIEETAQRILTDLKAQYADRREILTNLDMESKQLPTTGQTSIDLQLTHLTAKAAKAHVMIDLTLHANIKYMAGNIIDEMDLNILFAELVNNAIISASQNEVRKVLITLELVDSIYIVNIFDSGDQFTAEVLKNIGLKPITTRADTGGHGMGLINIWEITKKYEASFIIDELPSSNSIFTKKISVKFDNKNKYILRSTRSAMSETLSDRIDITIDNTPK